MTAFLSPSTAYVLTAGNGRAFQFLGTLMTRKAGVEETHGGFGLIEQELPAGFAPPPHTHHAEDEAFYVLDGAITFRCGDQTLEATDGSFVFLPRDVAHGFTVAESGPARVLQLNAPAGLEQFFEELGSPAGEPARPPDFERLLALAPKYRVEIHVPSPGGERAP
jgi:quercetin dioxygenase-like cupin family protein